MAVSQWNCFPRTPQTWCKFSAPWCRSPRGASLLDAAGIVPGRGRASSRAGAVRCVSLRDAMLHLGDLEDLGLWEEPRLLPLSRPNSFGGPEGPNSPGFVLRRLCWTPSWMSGKSPGGLPRCIPSSSLGCCGSFCGGVCRHAHPCTSRPHRPAELGAAFSL